MSFEFRPASRETTSVLIALAGPSGSGKTFSAISLALGLAYPGMQPEEILATIDEEDGRSRVALIDTEGGRALHYAPKPGQRPDFQSSFPFEYAEIKPPFTPQAYQDAFVAADEAGFSVVIGDSVSHEYEGEGGILEWADRLADGVPKPGIAEPESWKRDHWIEQPVKSPGNWKEPKRAHKRMMSRLLQCRCHMIFCLRAEEKMKLVHEKFTDQQGREKSKVNVVAAADRPLEERWEPICEKRFMYEMTASFLLVPSEPGKPIPIKLQQQHRDCFPRGEFIGPKSGARLAEWASGETDAAPAETRTQEAKTGAAEPSTAAQAEWVAGYIKRIEAATSYQQFEELRTKYAGTLAKIQMLEDQALYRQIRAAHDDFEIRFSED